MESFPAMPNRRKIDPHEAAKMRDAGQTISQIAEHFEVTEQGIYYALRSINYVHKGQSSHREWLPWELAEEHRRTAVATYIRRLGRLADGERLYESEQDHVWTARTVLAWGNEIVDAGMDYDYDPEAPPNDFSSAGGFFLREADPDNWKIKKLLTKVRRVQSRIK